MTGIILLAAGASQRLGQPKQLLPWGDSDLLRHAAEIALEADLGPVAVVLGAVDDACRDSLKEMPVQIITNPQWHTGMGSSIAAGMHSLEENGLENVIVMLCDQPFIHAENLRELVSLREQSGCETIASRYNGTLGPPALFSQNRFDQLRALEGKTGAKSILQNETSCMAIDCINAKIDIDTPDDWRRAVAENKTVKTAES
jgi:molybdenum cofactor cytidylyltransferase